MQRKFRKNVSLVLISCFLSNVFTFSAMAAQSNHKSGFYSDEQIAQIVNKKNKKLLLKMKPELASDIEYFFSLDSKKRAELLKEEQLWVVGLVAGVVLVVGALAGNPQHQHTGRSLSDPKLVRPMIGQDGKHLLDY